MSQNSIQAQVPLVKGKTVYMVLYNYCEHDFSIIKKGNFDPKIWRRFEIDL